MVGLFGAQTAQAQGSTCTFAPKTDRAVYNEPAVPSLPTAGSKVCDPTFGTEIMRVTDAADGQSNGTYYSYWPTFNSNSTRLLVRINDSSAATYIFDPATFTLGAKQSIPGLPGGGSLITEGAIWSNSDPNVLYGVAWNAPKLWSLNVATGTYTLVHDFSNLTGVASNDYLWQMSMSNDNDVFAFTRRNSAGTDQGYIVYKRSTGQISNVTPFSIGGKDINEVQIDKSGLYLSIPLNGNNDFGKSFYVRKWLNGTEDSLSDAGGGNPSPAHSDTGTSNIVHWDRWDNRFLYRNLGDLQNRVEILAQGSDWTQSSHISMRAVDESWALISFFNSSSSTPRNGVFHNELVQVATDGSGRFRRLVHHHSFYHGYWDSPRANISRDGKFIAFTSTWGNTTRDDLFIARIDPPSGGQDVTWTNAVGATPNGNSLTKTSNTTSWNAGAISTQTLSGEGYVQFSTAEQNASKMCGLSYQTGMSLNEGQSYQEIEYALHLRNDGNVLVFESGMSKGVQSSYVAGNKFRVAIEGGVVKYQKSTDGITFTTFYTNFTPTLQYPMVVDTSLYHYGATITDASLVPTTPQVWMQAVGVAPSGNMLTKTSNTTSWNAGAISVKTLSGGDGYVEFSTNETGTGKMCGLSYQTGTSLNEGQSYQEIEFALHLRNDGNVLVFESGMSKGVQSSYATGDKFRVAIEGATVKYQKSTDGITFTTFYTNFTPTLSYPMVVDTSLYHYGATIANVMFGGSWN